MLNQIVLVLAFLAATSLASDSSDQHSYSEYHKKKPTTNYVVLKKPVAYFNAEKACKAHGLYFAHITGNDQLKAASHALEKACVKEAWIDTFSSSYQHHQYSYGSYDSDCYTNDAALILKNAKSSSCGQIKPIIVEVPMYKAWKKQLKNAILCQTCKPVHKKHQKVIIKKQKIVEKAPLQKYAKKYFKMDAEGKKMSKYHVKALEKVKKSNYLNKKKPCNTSKTSYTSYGSDHSNSD